MTAEELLPAEDDREVERAIARAVEGPARERGITPAHARVKAHERRACPSQEGELETERVDEQVEVCDPELSARRPAGEKERPELDPDRERTSRLGARSDEGPILVRPEHPCRLEIAQAEIDGGPRSAWPGRDPSAP